MIIRDIEISAIRKDQNVILTIKTSGVKFEFPNISVFEFRELLRELEAAVHRDDIYEKVMASFKETSDLAEMKRILVDIEKIVNERT